MERIGKKVSHYTIESQLGSGMFATVYLVQSDVDGKKYALKCINKSKINASPDLQRLLKTEVSIMNEIEHPNIMHLYEFLESKKNYYLVINYCNKGDLERFLMSKPKKLLSEKEAVYFMKQIMNGFQALHKRKVMHRDFKLANIFLNDDTIVIGDFGFAKAGHEMTQTVLGTPITMAPEVHQGEGSYTSKADLWSIGMVFYHLLYGEYPFYGLSRPELLANIREKSGNNLTFDDTKNEVSKESKQLLISLLQMEPKNRIDWQTFFNHPVFSNEHQALDSHLAKALGALINHRTEVEKEFDKNRQSIGPEENNKTLIDPLKMEMVDMSINPEIINETMTLVQGDSPSNHKSIFKEYTYRYFHENNKILVLYLTVKKLRQLMKEKDFKDQHSLLYLLMTVLAKKGSLLSEWTLKSLDTETNIFKLELFQGFCKGTEEFKETIAQLRKDQEVVRDYQDYIHSLSKNITFTDEEKAVVAMCNDPGVDVKALDDCAKTLFRKLRAKGQPIQLNDKPQNKQFYLLAMIYTIYSIKSDLYMPYINESGKKFEWDTFKQKHEELAVPGLEDLLNKLEE